MLGQPLPHAEQQVGLDGLAAHHALAATVLRDEGQPGAERLGRRAQQHLAAGDAEGAADVPLQSHHRAQQAGATAAKEPRHAQDLARVDRHVDVPQALPEGPAVHLQGGRPGPVDRRTLGQGAGVVLTGAAAGDGAHEAAQVEVGGSSAELHLPVAQDRDRVAHPQHLLQVVRDVDERDARGAQVGQDVEEDVDLGLRERGGGLVEDEDGR